MQRPSQIENEDDLLRIQEEFLTQRTEPSAKLHKTTGGGHSLSRDERTARFPVKLSSMSDSVSPSLSSHLAPVLSEIKEHTNMDFETIKLNKFTTGFPAVSESAEFVHQEGSSGKKRSLFAQQFMTDKVSAFGFKERAPLRGKSVSNHVGESFEVQFNDEAMETLSELSEKLSLVSNSDDTAANKGHANSTSAALIDDKGFSIETQRGKEKIELHNENLEKLSKMSHEEILNEKRKLESTLDPSLLKFIQTRKSKKGGMESFDVKRKCENSGQRDDDTGCPMLSQVVEQEHARFNPYTEFAIDRNLPRMDTVEYEKLEWMKDIEKHSWKQNEANNTVRFDFEGQLIARDVAIPVNFGLHHHGEDFAAPGYSLEELFKLARSSFLQQNVFALKLLAKICEQYQRGSFQGDIQGCLLQQLIDAGLPFLLRESLDESTSAIHCAAIYAIYAMLWNPYDNDALDELLYFSNGFEVPSLKPVNTENDIKTSKIESKGKLMDHEIMSIDLIKGLLQIQLLPRLRYILEVCHPDRITVNYCMDILSRITLHSAESATKIVDCPRLMDTVLNIFLPITWSCETSNERSFPCYKALRLIRLLCVAGKNISSRLWEHHDLCARVLRYTSLVNESDDPSQEEIGLAVEAIHIWRICIIKGVSISTTVEVHSFLISMLQKYAVTKRGLLVDIMSSAVLLAESIVRATVCYDKQKILDVPQLSQHENSIHMEANRIQWTVVSGFHIILMQSLSNEIKHFVSREEEIPLLRCIATLLSYLSAFIHSAFSQESVNKVILLSDISCWTDDLILKILESHLLSKLLEQIGKFSNFLTPLHLLTSHQEPRCFPSYGMKIFKDGPRITDENTVFVFLVSFTKLLHNIVVVNKSCIGKVLSFLRMQALLDYCRCISSSLSSAHKISSTAVTSMIERQFLYHLLILAEKAITLCPGSLEPSLCQTYHTTAFELLTLLQSGECILAINLMVGLIFNRTFYESSVDMKDIVARLCTLGIPANSEASATMEKLVYFGIESLGPTCDVYKKYCLPHPSLGSTLFGSGERGSLYNAEFGASLVPLDWIFLPIVSLYTININIQLSGQLVDQVTADAIRTIEVNLLFLLNIEVNKPEILKAISSPLKFIRLLCTFLLGSDVFLDPRIRSLLNIMFAVYTTEKALDQLEFVIPVPGVLSFYDLFCELLIQFSACSFGDHVFGNYLLVPLQQRHDVKYRKAIWGEHCDALKCFTMPIKSVKLNLSYFLDDIEQDEELIRLYLRGIISGTVTPQRCPFFYLVAVSHLNRFIFDAEQTEGSSDLLISKSNLRILNLVISMKCEISRSDIILFEVADSSLTKGFKTYRSLPSYRQLIINNRSTVLP